MGTPDLSGTYGTFAFYTSEPYAFAGQTLSGGVVHGVKVRDGVIRASLEGPDNPFFKKPEKVRAEFSARLDQAGQHVKITVGMDEALLAVGEWSNWLPVSFSLAPTQSIGGEVRFYLKGLDPFFELYASPVNIDPIDPAMPVSHPGGYAAELAEATGRFYTQGMPEDTKGLKTGVLTDAEFLTQAQLAADENRRQYRYVLDRFDDGLLFYYFGNVDQVSHMMWRARDPQHPAYNAVTDSPNATVVDELYRGLDAIVTDTLATLGPDDLLVVMSDHGFTSWRRAFHLNSWLRDNGYLTLVDPNRRDDPGFFGNVDWARTRVRRRLERLVCESQGTRARRHRRAWRTRVAGQGDRREAARHGRPGDRERRHHPDLPARRRVSPDRQRRHRARPRGGIREGHARVRRVGAG